MANRSTSPGTTRRPPQAAAIVLSACAVLCLRVAFATERIALRSEVLARTEVVRLSDLLPASAVGPIRWRLQEIAIGAAPAPGAHRVFQRVKILQSLHSSPELLAALEIPDAIDVTRWSRPVTRDELLVPIVQCLRANRFSGGDSLSIQDLFLSSAVLATEAAPKFEVTSVDAAPKGVTRVHILMVSEPRVPPFWVIIDRDIRSPSRPPEQDAEGCATGVQCHPERMAGAVVKPFSLRSPGRRRSFETSPSRLQPENASLPSSRWPSIKSPILVKAGEPVQLFVQAAGMRIATTAIPLALGREGDRIRVHAALNGKILVATVVARQTVEVDY